MAITLMSHRILTAQRLFWKHHPTTSAGFPNHFLQSHLPADSFLFQGNAVSTRSFSDDKTSDNKGDNTAAAAGATTTKDNNKSAEIISSSTAEDETVENEAIQSVYVHPLSQIVLRHFQTSCHDWIRSKRLDENLVIHRDGTFVLTPPDHDGDSSALRVWTYYDGEDRKHWLSVTVNQVQHRFLLQDNMLSAWRGYKRNSLTERVQESVQDLMDAVKELE